MAEILPLASFLPGLLTSGRPLGIAPRGMLSPQNIGTMGVLGFGRGPVMMGNRPMMPPPGQVAAPGVPVSAPQISQAPQSEELEQGFLDIPIPLGPAEPPVEMPQLTQLRRQPPSPQIGRATPPMTTPGFGEPTEPTEQGQQPRSNAAMWGLLAAGLGILANNYGRYGQAGPAIGLGGLTGLQTFLGERQQEIENTRRDELARQQAERYAATARYQDALIGQFERTEAKERAKQGDIDALVTMLQPSDPLQAQFAKINPDAFIEAKLKSENIKPPDIEWLPAGKNKEGLDLESPHVWDVSKKAFMPLPGFDPRVRSGQKPLVEIGDIKTVEDFNQASAKEQAKSLMATYDVLQTIPSQFQALDAAEKAVALAGGFVGSGAETKLAIAKFFNNNFGTDIGSKEVENAELLRSSLFRGIMENLKKLDAQPSQQQQKIMQESLGTIGTDPAAIPRIIQITRDALTSRAREHNRRVRQAIKNKAVFLYDITIPGFDEGAQKDPWER